MMVVVLKDHQVFLQDDCVSGSRKGRKIKKIDSLLPHLTCSVAIKANFLLGDLWRLIARDVKVFKIILRGSVGGHPLTGFLKEAAQWDGKRTKDKGYLEICNGLSFSFDGSKHAEITPWSDFCLVTPDERYSIMFAPIHELSGCELRLKPNTAIDVTGPKKPAMLKDVSGLMTYRVIDILHVIFWEISWFGPPVMRDAEAQRLNHDIEESNRAMLPAPTHPAQKTHTLSKKRAPRKG